MLNIRNIGAIGRTYRHVNRYIQILGILIKYGFDDIVNTLKIDQYIDIGLNKLSKNRERIEKNTRAERIRMALEELGPTCIKLGQLLSTRPDLVPVEFVQEFSKLQDKIPARPFAEVNSIIETEFGRNASDIYSFFDETPLASASIGQVHRAYLKTGEEVAVKVQRSGIRKIIEVDLEIMLHLATLMERHVEGMAFYRPVKIVEEFAHRIEQEIDYTIEASNMERFALQFYGDPTILVPGIFREATTERVLTTEFIRGIKISDIEKIEKAGLNRKIITARGADIFLRQVFDHGFFHADPHPGNIFVLPDNVICLLDFGMIGVLDRVSREDFVDLIEGVVNYDETGTCRMLLKITERDQEPDSRAFEKDVSEFMGQHLYKPIGEIHLTKLLQDLLDLVSRHKLRIPPDMFLMMKAFGTIEGLAVMLDPDFEMITQAKPFIERVKLARYHPQRIAEDTRRLFAEIMEFISRFPGDLLEISKIIRQRKLTLNIEHRGIWDMLATHDRISNRISFSIVIAALIIGSAMIIDTQIPPLVYGISLIGIVLFSAAALMGIWLLAAILRKGL